MADPAARATGRPTVAGSLWSVPSDRRLAAVTALREAGLTRLHWDASDGVFAAPGGFSASEAAAIASATGTTAEAHIMATEPLREIDAWAEVCDTVAVHAESSGWEKAVDRLERRGCRPALAVALSTSARIIPAEIAVLCMAITPGQAGSAFDERVLAKVAELRAAGPERPIGLDGGVTRAIAPRALAAGADWLVVGTDLFSADGAGRWSDLLA